MQKRIFGADRNDVLESSLREIIRGTKELFALDKRRIRIKSRWRVSRQNEMDYAKDSNQSSRGFEKPWIGSGGDALNTTHPWHIRRSVAKSIGIPQHPFSIVTMLFPKRIIQSTDVYFFCCDDNYPIGIRLPTPDMHFDYDHVSFVGSLRIHYNYNHIAGG
jgi:hypothetical protein